MSGDKFNLRVSSWYKKNGVTPGTPINPLSDLIAALNTSLGTVAGSKATTSLLQSNNTLNAPATSFYNSHTGDSTTMPKAYVNWILFDEQFNFVSSSSGFEQVGTDQQFKIHQFSNLPINKNGYLYVYVSNETPNIDVFFDNLQVTHIRGPILEETHYYPFGLTMAGISSKAVNFGGAENKKHKFQNQEYNDDFGIDMYEFKWRMDDPQIGRFWQIDPLADKYVYNGTYVFSEDKVIAHVELEGLETVEAASAQAWREVKNTFIGFANKIDHMFSRDDSHEKTVSTEKKTNEIEVKKSVETKTTSTLNFGLGGWMDHVANTNSNVGAPALKFEIVQKNEVRDKTTTTTSIGGGVKIVGTKSVSRTDGTVTTGITVSGPVKLGVIPNANVALGWSSNGNGSTTTSANLSGSGTLINTTYTSGVGVSLTGQSGNRSSTQVGVSVYGQSSSKTDVHTTTFKISW